MKRLITKITIEELLTGNEAEEAFVVVSNHYEDLIESLRSQYSETTGGNVTQIDVAIEEETE